MVGTIGQLNRKVAVEKLMVLASGQLTRTRHSYNPPDTRLVRANVFSVRLLADDQSVVPMSRH